MKSKNSNAKNERSTDDESFEGLHDPRKSKNSNVKNERSTGDEGLEGLHDPRKSKNSNPNDSGVAEKSQADVSREPKKIKKGLVYIDKITNTLEIVIAFILLIIIAFKVVDMVFEISGFDVKIITMEFERILSVLFTLVIGVEFVKMLCKHTPETVIDVLLFTIARQMVLSYDRTLDMFVGVLAISGLFAVKKYLTGEPPTASPPSL